MIAQVPKLPTPMIDEKEEMAIKELEEMEIQHNNRHDKYKIVNLITKAQNKQGKPCVEVDAMANLTYDPININTSKETVMIILLVRGDEASIRADVVGDIDVQLVNQITTMIPRPRGNKEDVATERADVQPEETNIPDTEDESSDTIHRPEMTKAAEVQPIPSTSSSRRESRKRAVSYIEESSSTSESSDESQDRNKRYEKQVKKKRSGSTTTRKTAARKTKPPKTCAKDGRKLADVTNRLRDEKGRLMGYKPGTEKPTKKVRVSPVTEKRAESIGKSTSHQDTTEKG